MSRRQAYPQCLVEGRRLASAPDSPRHVVGGRGLQAPSDTLKVAIVERGAWA